MKPHLFQQGACLGLHLANFSSPPQAKECERHHAKTQDMLEQWEKEKAEREQEHKKVLFEIRQKVATLLAQQEEEQARFEDAKREVMIVRGELV